MPSNLVKEVMEDIRSPLYQNAIFLILHTVLVAGAGFLFWLLVTRLLGSEEAVGQAILLVSVITLLTTVSTLGFAVGLIRYLPNSPGDKSLMVNSVLTVTAVVAAILAAFVLVTMDLWFPAGGDVLSLVTLAPIFLLLAVISVSVPIVDSGFVAGRKASFVLMRSSLFQAVRLVTPLVLIGLLGVIGVLASLVIAQLLALAVAFAILLPRLYPGFRLKPVVDRGLLGEMFQFSLGNHVGEIFHVLPFPVLLVIVSWLAGSAAVAFFGIPWLIASSLFAVPLMAGTSLYVEGSHFSDRLRKDLRRTLRFVLPLLILGIAFVWFFAEWLLSLFDLPFQPESLQLLRLLAVSSVFVTVNGLFIAVARVMKWVKAVIALWAYVAASTIVLAYFLLPLYGLGGVGYAWLLGNGTAALAVMAAYFLTRGSIRALFTTTADG